MTEGQVIKGGVERQARRSRQRARMQPIMKGWQQRVQVWEAELRNILGCKMVQMMGDFKMSSAVKCVGKERVIINIRKVLH